MQTAATAVAIILAAALAAAAVSAFTSSRVVVTQGRRELTPTPPDLQASVMFPPRSHRVRQEGSRRFDSTALC